MPDDCVVTILGSDPLHRKHALNGYAFQQDAITSFRGWQYAVFYSSLTPDSNPEPLYVHLARRQLPKGPWETIVFQDYPQTTDDGHNTVQLAYQWTSSLFTPTLDYLPGLPSTHSHFSYVTYPRLGSLGDSTLFMSLRDGKAGLGSDHLYLYRAETGFWEFVGTPLTGVDSNPYVHGWDYRNGVLHVTWVYRGFVWYEGWDDLADTKHKQQAGPNGAENNHNICYAYSKDMGYTWYNGKGDVIADLRKGETISNTADGIVAVEIPKRSGLMNQEAQAIDHDGGVHVLNRDTLDGEHMWKHHYREPSGTWISRAVRAINGPRRGRLAVNRDGDLYVILPETSEHTMTILKATKATAYSAYENVWVGKGLTGEPLIDGPRFENEETTLSLLVRRDVDGDRRERDVAVLDIRL